VLVAFAVRGSGCGWLNPPQLLLSVDSARVTDDPLARDSSAYVTLSGAAPQPVDVPVRDIVPVKGDSVLLVTVKNPVSGLAQIDPS